MGAFFAFALSPIGRFLITGAVMFALGAAAGVRGEKLIGDARLSRMVAAAKDLTIATLQARIKVANAATKEDQARAAAAESARVAAEERAKHAEALVANTPAFDAADTDRLRDLWGPAARRDPKR